MNGFLFRAAVVGMGILLPALALAQNQPTRYGERDPYGTINGSSSSSDFPTALVAAVPEARARSAAASANHDRATSELGQAIRRVQGELENSPEMRAALLEEREAYAALEQARANALAPITGQEEVLAAESIRKSITQEIQDHHASPTRDEAQVVALATLKMEIASRIREKESLALATDPAVVQARARHIVAAMKVNELRARNSDLVRNNPEVAAARRNLDDARIAKLASAAYVSAAIDARNIALNYNYYLHRWDYYRYATPQYVPYYGGGFYTGGYYSGGHYSGGQTYAWDPFIRVTRH